MHIELVAGGVGLRDGHLGTNDLSPSPHLGCDEAQGYFIARPFDGAALASWMGSGGWHGV